MHAAALISLAQAAPGNAATVASGEGAAASGFAGVLAAALGAEAGAAPTSTAGLTATSATDAAAPAPADATLLSVIQGLFAVQTPGAAVLEQEKAAASLPAAEGTIQIVAAPPAPITAATPAQAGALPISQGELLAATQAQVAPMAATASGTTAVTTLQTTADPKVDIAVPMVPPSPQASTPAPASVATSGLEPARAAETAAGAVLHTVGVQLGKALGAGAPAEGQQSTAPSASPLGAAGSSAAPAPEGDAFPQALVELPLQVVDAPSEQTATAAATAPASVSVAVGAPAPALDQAGLQAAGGAANSPAPELAQPTATAVSPNTMPVQASSTVLAGGQAPTAPSAPAQAAALAAALANPAVISITGEQAAAPVVAQTVRTAVAERVSALGSKPQGAIRAGSNPQAASTSTAAAQPASLPAQTASATAPGDPVASGAAPQTGQPIALEAVDAAAEPTGQAAPVVETMSAQGSAPTEARAAAAVRGSPETVASLAAEIARKLEARNSRFEVALDPLGLGVVNVSIDIGADGRLSAQMAFERPEAAAELRGRGAELQRALEQAGFDLSRGGLSFEHGGGRERPGGDQPRGQQARAQAFQAALLAAETADALPAYPLRLRDRAGLDVRI